MICDCLWLPFRSETADYCVCIAVIHHLSTKERRIRALREIARILRPGGRALIYVWARNQRQTKAPSSYLKQKRRGAEEASSETFSHSVRIPQLDQNSAENGRLSLPVHVNRTQFKHDDVLVPWKLKPNAGLSAENFLRFYHVFDEGELEKLCLHVENVHVVTSYYDQGNWCVQLEKSR